VLGVNSVVVNFAVVNFVVVNFAVVGIVFVVVVLYELGEVGLDERMQKTEEGLGVEFEECGKKSHLQMRQVLEKGEKRENQWERALGWRGQGGRREGGR
jgi:hypothetical protein